MPIEFSGAAFRYGHATEQSSYVLNDTVQSYPLFQMGRNELTIRQDQAHNVEFKHVFDYPGNGKFLRARPIGPKVASVLYALPFETQSIDLGGVVIDAKQAKILPLLNLMRDRTALHVPSGQQVAKAIGIPSLDAPKELTNHEITKTPLWYYCLQEATSHKGKLGPVGGTIVVTVKLRLLHLDAESIF